jgi:hypothetical protein
MARTLAEIDADIVEVRTAMSGLRTGLQAFSADGRTGQKVDYAALSESLKELERERVRVVAAAAGGRISYAVPSP